MGSLTLQAKLALGLGAAAVVALFLLAASHRYQLTPSTSQRQYELLLDRWTGKVQACFLHEGCFDLDKIPSAK